MWYVIMWWCVQRPHSQSCFNTAQISHTDNSSNVYLWADWRIVMVMRCSVSSNAFHAKWCSRFWHCTPECFSLLVTFTIWRRRRRHFLLGCVSCAVGWRCREDRYFLAGCVRCLRCCWLSEPQGSGIPCRHLFARECMYTFNTCSYLHCAREVNCSILILNSTTATLICTISTLNNIVLKCSIQRLSGVIRTFEFFNLSGEFPN